MEIEEVSNCEALPLLSLNHVSLLCRSVWTSMRFYEEVLGFVLIKRPSSFNFNGAWLYNYGIGIHLIESPAMEDYELRPINPKDNHISFQCTDVGLVKRRLQDMGMRYVTAVVEDDGVKVDQVFFHDPDGYMIELCNCENIPIIPISACSFKPRGSSFKKAPTSCGFMETLMMESLSLEDVGEETRVNCLGLISGDEMLVIDAFTTILIRQIFTFGCGFIHGRFISKKHYGLR